ncbi:MAG: class I SAM-dependent methyltransferase [Alphaproteobacteria bacterium]|nr:class I SAM-dependent methyltransferase [Alphaproteobacteria bacterium]MCB9694221.1 class I SAM-dependent methyltransferase [Alphaproteobacteria bacterium]
MADLFHDKAEGWDSRPVPQQISEGVFGALDAAMDWSPDEVVMDFGAGTGLLAGRVAPHVGRIVAVDVSPAMLERLAAKPELAGKVDIRCQDLLEAPLDLQVDAVVSAMAAHHVEDTAGLMRALFTHLKPGGRLALADLDAEDGTFHPPEAEGVFHAGFERDALAAHAAAAGFVDIAFVTACEVGRDDPRYPIFLLTAQRP